MSELIVVTLANSHPRLRTIISNVERSDFSVKGGFARLKFDDTILYRIKLEKFTEIYNSMTKEQKT